MQVYIEYVILNNLFVNMLILTLALKFMRYKINKLAIFASSSLGAVYAVFLPLCDTLNIFIIKAALSLIMVAIVVGRCKFKRYVKVLALFFALTFALGGAVTGMGNMLSYELKDSLSSLTPCFVALTGLSLVAAQKLIYKYVTMAKRRAKYEDIIILCANGVEVRCKAYYDSGNRLYYKNKPTIIIDESIALKLYGQNGLNKLNSFTQIDTVIGKKDMKVIPIDYLKEQKRGDKIYGVMAAISEKICGEYKVVLHCDL